MSASIIASRLVQNRSCAAITAIIELWKIQPKAFDRSSDVPRPEVKPLVYQQ